MKKTLLVVVSTFALSAAFWLAYYVVAGGIPPPSEVTTILVGIALGIVFGIRWLWQRTKKIGDQK